MNMQLGSWVKQYHAAGKYIVKNAPVIKIPKQKKGFHRLPFVSVRTKKKTETPLWNIPCGGGYVGGYDTGRAMALLYLKNVRECDDSTITLSHILDSIAVRYEQERVPPRSSRVPSFKWKSNARAIRGQKAGFLNTLGEHLDYFIKKFPQEYLDNLTEEELVDAANSGLAFDEDAAQADVQ